MKILSAFLFAALCLIVPAYAQVINPGTGGGGGGSGTVTSVGFTGGLLSVATPTTTPAFTVAGTSGGVPFFSGASTWASSAAGTVNHVMLWGGAGAAPTDGGALPTGTVTSIATTGPITGGTITGTGTIACATCGVTGSPLSQFAATTSAQLLGTLSDATGTGAAVFGTSPTLTTPAITTSSTLSNNSLGTSPAGGYVIQNTTAAAAGAQQYSPPITLIGQGWKTTATAASQTVKWDIYNQPRQNSTTPTSELIFLPTINGTAGISMALCNLATATAGALLTFSGIGSCGINGPGTGGDSGFGPTNGSNQFGVYLNFTQRINFNTNGTLYKSDAAVMFASGTLSNATTGDASLQRDSAGVLASYSGAAVGTTAANYRVFKGSGFLSGGTTFTASGLSVGTLVGGATAGTFALGSNGPGTVVVTMGNSATAPTGWSCWGSDRSVLTALVDQSASTTTTATMNIPTGALSGDVISFGCLAY